MRLDAVEFCVVEATLLLPTSVLHQKTSTKCYRPNVACSDQYAGHPFLVLLLMLPARRRQIVIASLHAFFPLHLSLYPRSSSSCPPQNNEDTSLHLKLHIFILGGLWRVCRG